MPTAARLLRLLCSASLLCALCATAVRGDGTGPAAAAAAPVASVASITDEVQAYRDFRRLYEARQYPDALPLALQIVKLIEAQPDRADQLPTALNNLGAVQLELGDHAGAITSFSRALDLLERSQGVGSRRMISPLVGLGRAHAAEQQHAHAIGMYQRALSISRRADGLFNLAQLDIIEPLVASLMVVEDYASTNQLREYALQVVEHRYGVDDPRTLPAVNRLADWFEFAHQFLHARILYLRSFRIASQTAGGRNATAIAALRGIARTHRLQYVLDPDSTIAGPQTEDFESPGAGRWATVPMLNPLPQNQAFAPSPRLNPEGEQVLRRALKIIGDGRGVPPELLGAVHVDLGDWYLTAHRPDEALRNYRIAWPLLPTSVLSVNRNPLLRPRLVLYRPPESALRRRDLPRGETVRKPVEFVFTVTARGEVREVRTVSSEVNKAQEAAAREALLRAAYCPRFENGEPVDTPDVQMREYFYDLVKKSDDDTSPTNASPAAGATPSPSPSPSPAASPPPAAPAPVDSAPATPETPASPGPPGPQSAAPSGAPAETGDAGSAPATVSPAVESAPQAGQPAAAAVHSKIRISGVPVAA
ncbi:MAG: tetratricopeptide repeat protein [Steroidobacteraceae bacterium]